MSNHKAQILSNKPFNENTYTVVHTQSSLNLNDNERDIVTTNWQKLLDQAKTKGVQQWDGTFYRMENIQDLISGSKELKFSTMKYSEVRALKDDPTLSKKFRANNISTSSLIKTSDNYFIFGVRNINSMSKSKVDLIGGGLQESELVVNTFSDVFKNEFKEIKEETGLTEKDILSMQGIGILQSGRSNVLFVFFTKLKKSKDEVEKIFSKNNDDEMDGLEFIEESLLKKYLNNIGDYRPLTGELYFENLK
jgi:hypothetical protein